MPGIGLGLTRVDPYHCHVVTGADADVVRAAGPGGSDIINFALYIQLDGYYLHTTPLLIKEYVVK